MEQIQELISNEIADFSRFTGDPKIGFGPEFQGPYPWEIDMTLCIAAISYGMGDLSQARIVLCADWKISNSLGSSDTGLKLRTLSNHFVCLTSGAITDIKALVKLLQREFKLLAVTDETTVGPAIRRALEARKAEKAHEYVYGRFGLSFDDFFKFGKEKLPADIFNIAWREVAQIDLGAELIVAGFVGGVPTLYRTDKFCGVSLPEPYIAIGEGAILASAILLQRDQRAPYSVGRTLYNLYEAKRYAEKVPSVGKESTFAIVQDGQMRKVMDDSYAATLEQWYNQFGPQKVQPSTVDQPVEGWFS